MNAQLRHTRHKGQHDDGDEEFDAGVGAMQPAVARHIQVGVHQRSSLSFMLGDFQQHVGRRNGPVATCAVCRAWSRGRLLLRRCGPVDRPILHDLSVLQFEHVRAVPVYGAHVVADHDDGDAMPVEFFHGSKES